MEIEEHRQGAVLVLRPTGALVAADAEIVKARILDALGETHGRLVLDVAAVPFTDSRGLEVLVEANTEMAQIGQVLRIAGATDTVRQALDLTGIAEQFEYFEETNAAVRSFL